MRIGIYLILLIGNLSRKVRLLLIRKLLRRRLLRWASRGVIRSLVGSKLRKRFRNWRKGRNRKLVCLLNKEWMRRVVKKVVRKIRELIKKIRKLFRLFRKNRKMILPTVFRYLRLHPCFPKVHQRIH